MKIDRILSYSIIGASVALAQSQFVVAQFSSPVNQIAKKITVQIEGKNSNSTGSGVIITKKANTYTILTAAHVINKPGNYEITTYDGQSYLVKSIKKLPNVDLGIVEFTSDRAYRVASIGNSDTSLEGTKVYVSGFPTPTARINHPIYIFTDGVINASSSQPLVNGYGLAYSNNTLPGMSGGAVLNERGELIGIHGRGDTTENFQSNNINSNIVLKTGFNLGIPINTFVKLATANGIDVGIKTPQNQINDKFTATDFFLQGKHKYHINRNFKGAIADLTRAIKLNPKYGNAFIVRGDVRANLKNFKGAIADYTQAIKIKPNSDSAYIGRGTVYAELKDYQKAIEDFTQAIKVNPKNALAYNNRSAARLESKDYQGVIEDSTQAIKLDSINAPAYTNRSAARVKLRDYQGAIEDSTRAIEINPNIPLAYTVRSIARRKLKDLKGANADSQKAAELDLKQKTSSD